MSSSSVVRLILAGVITTGMAGLAGSAARADGPPAAPAPVPSIAGPWQWEKGGVYFVHFNGTVSGTEPGTWKFSDPAKRVYTVEWKPGVADVLTLSTDGEKLSGTRQDGAPVNATRVHPKPEAKVDAKPDAAPSEIAGVWDWYKGGVVTIRPDGTFQGEVESGTWEIVAPHARAYRLTWKPGWIDLVKLSSDNQFLEGENQYGTKVWGARKSAAALSEMVGYWGWWNGLIVIARPDGSVNAGVETGRWEQDAKDKRLFTIKWKSGFVDTLSMSPDGKQLTGKNQAGEPISGTKK